MSNAYRLPPQNIEAEQGLIGSILIHPDVIDDLPPGFRSEHFYRDSSRTIFDEVSDTRARGIPVDLITIEEALRKAKQLDRIGGINTLLDAMESVPHCLHAPHYAGLISQAAMRRDIIRVCCDAIDGCYTGDIDAEDIAEQVQESLFGLTSGSNVDRVATMAEIMVDVMARIATRRQGEVDGLTTGLKDLDYLIGGLVPGRLIVLASRPAMGKTSISINIANHVASTGCGVFFVSLEMGSGEIGERALSGESGVDGSRIRDALFLRDEELARVEAAAGTLSMLKLSVDDTPGLTVGKIATTGRRLKAKRGIGLIVVDYVQLLDVEKGRGNPSRQEQVAMISRRLKQLARQLDVPVLALSQLNRSVETREGHRPMMSDLRESGALEQDADQVLLLHRPEYYDPNDKPGIAELIVAKNRHGATGLIDLVFDKATTTFRPLYPGDENEC